MSDYSITSESESFGMQFSRMAGQIRCALPGIIMSFSPEQQTATVKPAIKMKVNLGEGVQHIELPEIVTVPVVLPYAQSTGLLLTLPISKGDECLLVFADRSIDNFLQSGGVQTTTDTGETSMPRSHSLSDAICIPGIISKPQVVTEYSLDNIELRDKERKQYISLGAKGITITDGVAVWRMHEGSISVDAQEIQEKSATASRETTGVNTLIGSNISIGKSGSSVDEIQNSLKSRGGTFIDKNGRDSTNHIHSGVKIGDGVTGKTAK